MGWETGEQNKTVTALDEEKRRIPWNTSFLKGWEAENEALTCEKVTKSWFIIQETLPSPFSFSNWALKQMRGRPRWQSWYLQGFAVLPLTARVHPPTPIVQEKIDLKSNIPSS